MDAASLAYFSPCVKSTFLLMTESSFIRLSTQRGAMAISIPMVPYASNKGIGGKNAWNTVLEHSWNTLFKGKVVLEHSFGTQLEHFFWESCPGTQLEHTGSSFTSLPLTAASSAPFLASHKEMDRTLTLRTTCESPRQVHNLLILLQDLTVKRQKTARCRVDVLGYGFVCCHEGGLEGVQMIT